MKQSNWQFLRVYLRPYKLRLSLLTTLLLLSIGLQLVAPQVMGDFLDTAQAGGANRAIAILAAVFFIIVFSQKVIALITTYLSEDLGWAATNQLRVDLAAHCLRLDMDFHKARPPGELIARIDGDVGTLAEYFSRLVVQVLGNGLLALGVLVILFAEEWRVGLVGLAYALLILVFLRAIQNRVVGIWKQVRQGFAEMYGFLEERISGTEDIRANGGEVYVMQRLYPLMNQVARLRVKGSVIGTFTFTVGFYIYVLSLVGTLALAATAYLNNRMSIGTVFLLVYYIGVLEGPLNTIRRHIADLQRALASIGRIHEFFQLQPVLIESVSASLPDAAPVVRFETVSFTYKDNLPVNGRLPTTSAQNGQQPTVLQDISLTLPAGNVLGILGRTGSGKTTLTRLLFRLYDVDAGAITLDNINIRDVSLSDLRQRVGMVTQDVQLFAATVRDNLTLFHNDNPALEPIGDAQILTAIETLGLGEWYHALPDGLDTVLKSGGKGLSAGEAQLLAFTRVFIRQPRLVILDEASSRLDPATEQLLERAIDRLMDGRTGIIIAHRLSTVQRADDILILENGRVAEQGPRLALAHNPNSRFYSLLQTGLEEVLA